jgi:hypothetical protein
MIPSQSQFSAARPESFRQFWATLAVLCLVLLGPLLITDVPPVLDYPNHLARLVLLAAGPDDPVLGPIFTPQWRIIPNLAIDLIGVNLVKLLPVHVAGRCLLAGGLLLNLAGVVALHRVLFNQISFWPLACGLMAYNSTFLLGFLNWQIGSGLAMLFAALWMGWRERYPVATIATAAIASVLLFFCHLMGLVFFLVLVGSAEVYQMRRWRDVLLRSIGLLPVLVGPGFLTYFTALRDEPIATHWVSPQIKLVQAAGPFINYVFSLDMFSATLVYGGIALGITRRWLVLAPRAIPAAVVLPIAYLVLPFDLMSTSFLDTRVAIMFGFLLFAAVDPVWEDPWVARAVAIGCVVLLAVRMTILVQVWTEHRKDLSDLRAVIASVPPRSTVYLTDVRQDEAPAYWDAGPRSRRFSSMLRADYHMPALLLIERGAFWPLLFANPAQQPIKLQPDFDKLVRDAHSIPSHAFLVNGPTGSLAALYAFDFVLMLGAGADPNLNSFLPRCLVLVSQSDFAALFRVSHELPGCGLALQAQPLRPSIN